MQDTTPLRSYRLLRSPIANEFRSIASECERSFFVASPFINAFGVELLANSVGSRNRNIEVQVLTNINVRSLQEGGLDAQALVNLCRHIESTGISSLQGLHAKVYVVDNRIALITSANLTRGGLLENYEYAIRIDNVQIVQTITEDMRLYANLGNVFTLPTLVQLAQDVVELRSLQLELEREQRKVALTRQVVQRQRTIEDRLLSNRVRERTINSIFAETILYLLRSGPMTTVELETRIKEIHPDICDDSIDRVINGQRFGKKWKHAVRNAQQFLKRRAEIIFQSGKWSLS